MPADAGPAATRTTAGSDRNADPDTVIEAERSHLVQSREFLHLMRENVLQLAVNPMAGDRVSLEFLKADLYRRAEALKDVPDAPLFFGRLDYSELADKHADFAGAPRGAPGGRPPGLALHIGRRHVHDPDGTPVVLDWRAPVSRAFYRASQSEPMGLTLRRRFGFAGGALTAFEDERFAAGGATSARYDGSQAPSQLLISEIERPRSGPMRDIVATIQPEQDDIVRAGAGTTVCVQGAPGTGKTAVGLHRVAFLLYAYKEQVTRRGVIVVGPNLAFLSYIRNVLPALGELDVTQTTVTGLVASTPVKGTDTDEAAVAKGDVRMAEVIKRALWAKVGAPREPLVVSRGTRRLRLPVHEIEALATELRERGVRYGTGRDLLAHRIAHVFLSQLEAAGETCDDRTHDAVRRMAPVRKCVDQVWPKVDPKKLVFSLLSDPTQLTQNGRGLLTEAEMTAIAWPKPPRGPGSAPWSRADQVLIDEAADLIERMPSIAHIVVDEAQDLSPMEVRAIGRRCATGAATVLGDIAQGTTPWAATSWQSLLEHLGKPDSAVRELDVGYRVPRQILDFASRLLPVIAPGLAPAKSLRADPDALRVAPVRAADLGREVAGECATALARAGSVAVICADQQIPEVAAALRVSGLAFTVLGDAPAPDAPAPDAPAPDAPAPDAPAPDAPAPEAPAAATPSQLTLVPVTLAKGLEFDHVVLVEPGRIATGEAYGLRRLYVALTRAVSRLTVFHAEPLPAELSLRTIEGPSTPVRSEAGRGFRPARRDHRRIGAREGDDREARRSFLRRLTIARGFTLAASSARRDCAWPRQNYDQQRRWCSVEAKGNHAAATVYLDKLADELTNRGLEAWLMAPPGRVPSVYITNPGARALEENVYANQGKDGLWWFWWSWAERVSMADDVDGAAATIARVLSPHRANG
jgi:DNA helicase IV